MLLLKIHEAGRQHWRRGWQAALAARLSLLDLGDHASSVACSSNQRKEFKPRGSGTVPTELFWRPIAQRAARTAYPFARWKSAF